jgi:hypothetical protein
LYWGGKNKKSYWWKDIPWFFSPRWWSNEIVTILEKYWVITNKKEIQKNISIFWEKAENVKFLFWNNVYSTYLEEKWDFNIEKLEVNNNKLNLIINLKWKHIEFEWKVEWDNEIINTFIELLNQHFWYDRVKIKNIDIKSKPDIITEINNFRRRAWNILSKKFNTKMDLIIDEINKKSVSKSKEITQVVLDIDWKEVYSMCSGNNTSNSWIKAVLDWVINIL